MTRAASSSTPVIALAAAGCAVLLGTLAGISPVLGVGAAAGLVFVAVVVADLRTGFAAMVLFAYTETLSTLEGLSVAKLAGVVIAGAWLALVTSRQRDLRNPFADHAVLMYLLLAFLGWTAMSISWSEDGGVAATSVTRYALNALLIPIAYTAVRERADVVRVFGVLTAGATIAALSGVLVDRPAATQYDIARAAGTAGDPNELAAALVLAFWVAAAFAGNRHVDGRGRLAAGAVAVLCLAGIVTTLSRGGLIGLAVASAVAILLGGRRRTEIGAVVALVAVAGLGYFTLIASGDARDRVLHSGGGSGRVDLWHVGERMVQAHPLRGVGTGQYIVSSVHYLLRPGAFRRGDLVLSSPKVAHNTYLGTLAELGLVGFALFAAIAFVCGRCAWQAVKSFERQGDERLELLCRGFVVGACGYAVCLFFISENYKKLLWVVLAMGPVLLSAARAAERAGDGGRTAMAAFRAPTGAAAGAPPRPAFAALRSR